MLLNKIKLSLRVDDTDLDEDIQDAIDAAVADLQLSGIIKSKIVDTDPLIVRAIKTFCKAEFSSDDKEANRYRECYDMLKTHLSLSTDYNTEVVTP
ncbi:head-tail connector protein [Clostridium magnum]|uniref:Phage gp6-like head-tail connector protein n=1 Tax=Clostridium magnum DSM 2767 TaxID=1121326 RepID=A0A162UWR3_9CLOT|nr:head-tail connector protein [Clostridium magnum]KZL94363.1 hypothetical protein CLMAG_14160 [Clostridium magnum DSM 2767]SHJ49663.1 uncharacterized phage protein (possible DNA packaging) [Clostridium magnum DSM 2767]